MRVRALGKDNPPTEFCPAETPLSKFPFGGDTGVAEGADAGEGADDAVGACEVSKTTKNGVGTKLLSLPSSVEFELGAKEMLGDLEGINLIGAAASQSKVTRYKE